MTRWLKFWPLAAALAAFLGFQAWEAHLRSDGALRERERGLQAHSAAQQRVITALVMVKAKVDTVAGKAVVVYREAKGKADSTASDTASTKQDVVLACSAAIRAADSALASCATQVAVRDSLIARQSTLLAVKDSLLTVEHQRRPGFFARTFGCTAGVAATLKGAGLGASCGIKLF